MSRQKAFLVLTFLFFSNPFAVAAQLDSDIKNWRQRDDMFHPPVPYPLEVILPNGEVIQHRYGSDTFVEAIEKIGIERVKSLNLMYGDFPLIDTAGNHPTGRQRASGDYYIRMPSAPYRQRIVLRRIAEGLSIELIASTR